MYAPCDIDLDVLWAVKNQFETESKLSALDRRTVTLLSEQGGRAGATRRRVTECRLEYNPVPKLFQRLVRQEHLRTRVDSEWYDTRHDAKHPCISRVSLPHFDEQFPFSITVWQWLDAAGKDGVTNRIVTRVNIDIRGAGPASAVAERIMEHDMRQSFYRYPGSLLEHCRVSGIATHPTAVDTPPVPVEHEQQQRDALMEVPLRIEDAAAEETSQCRAAATASLRGGGACGETSGCATPSPSPRARRRRAAVLCVGGVGAFCGRRTLSQRRSRCSSPLRDGDESVASAVSRDVRKTSRKLCIGVRQPFNPTLALREPTNSTRRRAPVRPSRQTVQSAPAAR